MKASEKDLSASVPPVNAGGGVTAPTFFALRAKLYAKRDELRERMHTALAGLTVERPAEQVERVTGEVARENTAAEVRRLRALASDVEYAIKRMELGVYGECVSCGGPMLPKRLEAIPWAADCIRCTEAKERA